MSSPIGRWIDRHIFGEAKEEQIKEFKRANDLKEREVIALEKLAKFEEAKRKR